MLQGAHMAAVLGWAWKGLWPHRAQQGMSRGNSEVSGRAEVPGQRKHSGDEGCWSRAEPGSGSRDYRAWRSRC